MGKRSRKRGGGLPPEAVARPAATDGGKGTGQRLPRRDERPKAPWHPVPLVELAALAGIVLLVVGLFNYEEESGRAMIAGGLVLGSLAGLDTALREHFSGYRSHAMLLAALPAIGLAAILFFAGAPWLVVSAVPLLTFVAALPLLLRAYRRREG